MAYHQRYRLILEHDTFYLMYSLSRYSVAFEPQRSFAKLYDVPIGFVHVSRMWMMHRSRNYLARATR
jgi:hypothetical protein